MPSGNNRLNRSILMHRGREKGVAPISAKEVRQTLVRKRLMDKPMRVVQVAQSLGADLPVLGKLITPKE